MHIMQTEIPVDLYYAEKAYQHLVTAPGLRMTPFSNTENSYGKGTVTKKLYSCPANTVPFALSAKATNLFVVGTTTTQLQVSFLYPNIYVMCSPFYLTSCGVCVDNVDN